MTTKKTETKNEPNPDALFRAALTGLVEAFCEAREHDDAHSRGHSLFTMPFSGSPWRGSREAIGAALVALVDPSRAKPPEPGLFRVKGDVE